MKDVQRNMRVAVVDDANLPRGCDVPCTASIPTRVESRLNGPKPAAHICLIAQNEPNGKSSISKPVTNDGYGMILWVGDCSVTSNCTYRRPQRCLGNRLYTLALTAPVILIFREKDSTSIRWEAVLGPLLSVSLDWGTMQRVRAIAM